MPSPVPALSDKALLYKYTKLKDLRPGQDINVYGYIVRYSGPFKTRGTDWCMSLTIIDDSCPRFEQGAAHAIPIQLFHPDPSRFPKITNVGDVIQLRHIRVQRYKDTLQGLSMRYTAFTVFSKGPNGDWTAEPAHALTVEEQQTVEAVYLGSTTMDSDAAIKKPSTPYLVYDSQDPINKVKTISEAQAGIFADYIVQVYKLVSAASGRTNILVTDYTENDNIYWDIEDDDIQYMRKRLMFVTFWDKYATFASTLKEGDVVILKGIKTSTYDDKLAASMHNNEHGSAEERIIKLSNDSIEAATIMRRKLSLQKLAATTKELGNIELTVCKRVKKVPKRSIASMKAAAMEGTLPFGLVNARVLDVIQKTPIYKGLYVLEMVLQDDTDTMRVIVYDKDGEEFFGCKAQDFSNEQMRRFDRLRTSSLPNPFMIKAYKSRGSIIYKLFNTTLVG